MISSMTGYGRGEATEAGKTAVAEIRTVNNRFLEVTSRLPRALSLRENDVKELIRQKLSRGKVNVVITLDQETVGELPVRVNTSVAQAYYKLLTELRQAVGITEPVSLTHLLNFSEVLEADQAEESDEKEWELISTALNAALDGVVTMRRREGGELQRDLAERITLIERILSEIETSAGERLPAERERLRERLQQLLADPSVIDQHRLEFELALFVDKLDVTEECVRFRSHNKFFLDALRNDEAAGRKLNFLIQEMNREANTIGSKANAADVAHKVVAVKEEIEKIREQLQNIE
jgi:uncharacterized protein (TIGR00255 family)